jgi:hypothetical protein
VQFSSSEDKTAASLALPVPPRLTQQDSDTLLSYYGSEDAGGTYSPTSLDQETLNPPGKEVSASSSGSTAREDSNKSTLPKTEFPAGSRRSGTRSEGGTDRRRLAIVQMDSSNGDPMDPSCNYTGDSLSSNSLRSRRGFGDRLGDLALVAPPDASPRMYTYLTPPSTAPASSDRMIQPDSTTHSNFGLHHRSQSDAVNPIKQGGHYPKLYHNVGTCRDRILFTN